jgi:transcriptional regulator with XRE-family HTH domain
MAGHAKEPGPSSVRVAANLKRLRQERGLSYAELARRLAASDIGHPILDTGLIKIERGDRRVDVDDLVALAVALDVTPNALLIPHSDVAAIPRSQALTGDVAGSPQDLWAWATGEVPLGSRPASATSGTDARQTEIGFNRANQPHRWTTPTASVMRKGLRDPLIGAFIFTVLAAFKSGMDTAEIRDIWATALMAALIVPEFEEATEVRIFEADGQYRIEVTENRDGQKNLVATIGTPAWAGSSVSEPAEPEA